MLLSSALLSSLLFVLSLHGCSVSAQSQYPPPLEVSGDISIHDPALTYDPQSKLYYLFSSHDGISIRTATRLSGPYRKAGKVLGSGCSIIQHSGACDPWAPDVQRINGKWHLTYAISKFGTSDSAIGYATSSSPAAGGWTDHGQLFSSTPPSKYNAIDSNIVEDGGKFYLTFGSFWEDIWQVELNSAATAVRSGASPIQLAFNKTGSHAEEGAFVYPKNGFYYLFYSQGVCCELPAAAGEEYKIFVGRSSSPSGPFVDAKGRSLRQTGVSASPGGTLVLASHDQVYAPGGQSVFFDPVSKRDVLVYNYGPPSNPMNFVLGLNHLDFSSGWPKVVA